MEYPLRDRQHAHVGNIAVHKGINTRRVSYREEGLQRLPPVTSTRFPGETAPVS